MTVHDFIHPSDKKALDALKAVPGFDLVFKKFMSVVGEKLFQIESTSSYLKLGPDQLPEIYNILLKVCKKLEIDVPELYLSLDRDPNAYTYGDTDIFIVLNSGLLETMTLEQIETVIAHECGHIVCHHVLYRTMGRFIINGAEVFVSGLVSRAIVTSLQYAFYYWMRCSEFSADRVSAYYHQSAEPVIDLMMAFSGGTRNLNFKLNREVFLKQAQIYKALIDNSTLNKVIEFVEFGKLDHPLNAYRAYEVNEFYKRYTTKLSSENKDESNTEKGIDAPEAEYNLRIRYEYIKPKNLLKLGGMFDNNSLEVKIGKKKYSINKNDTKDIVLKCGKYEIYFGNAVKKIKHKINLRYDTNIVVYWDSNEGSLTVQEEI